MSYEQPEMSPEPSPSPSQDQSPKQKRRRRTKAEMMNDPANDTGSSSVASRGKVKQQLDVIKARFDALFFGVGTLVSGLDRFDGAVIQYGGPNVSDALVHTAETDARFREYLYNFCNASGYAELITAVAGIMLPIAARHGMAPGMFIYMAPEQAQPIAEQLQKEAYERSVQASKDRTNGIHV